MHAMKKELMLLRLIILLASLLLAIGIFTLSRHAGTSAGKKAGSEQLATDK